MMLNTIRELLVTLQEIKCEAQKDEFMSATKQKIVDKNQQIADIFSLCDNVLLYGERVVIPKGATDYLQAVAKDRLTLVQDSRGFRGTNGGRLLLDCSS